MSLASGPYIQPQQPFFAPNLKAHADLLLNAAAPWLLQSSEPATGRKSRQHSKRHNKKSKKHKKRHSKQRLGAYILQLIGLICLILAAIKAFEPLTGVGFTLVIVGYKGGFDGDGNVGDVLGKDRKRHRKSKKLKEKGRLDEDGRLLKEEEV